MSAERDAESGGQKEPDTEVDPAPAGKNTAAKQGKKASQAKPRTEDRSAAETAVPATDSPSPKPQTSAGLQWLANNAWLAIAAVALLAIPAGLLQGAGAALLVLIATALISVIALFWNSVRTLLGETPISGADAYALAAPRAEEEQKQAVLRALKDVEFERSVGKITEEHYAELVTKYRAEAKRLLRSLDEEAGERRERVTRLVQKRLAAEGLAAPVNDVVDTHRSPVPEPKKKKKKGKAEPSAENETDRIQNADAPTAGGVVIEPIEKEATEAKPKSKSPVDITWKSPPISKTKESPAFVPPTKTCADCHTKNDPDANFCKKCGSKSFEGANKVTVKETSAETEKTEPSAVRDEGESSAEAAGDDLPEDTEKQGAAS